MAKQVKYAELAGVQRELALCWDSGELDGGKIKSPKIPFFLVPPQGGSMENGKP